MTRFPGRERLPRAALSIGHRQFLMSLANTMSNPFHVCGGAPRVDADIDEATIDLSGGRAFRYFAPAETEPLAMAPHTRTILGDFSAGPSYRALFH